jgi:hypothetical protein
VAWQLRGRELYASLVRQPPVRWSIASIPAEAEVLDENGKSLGKTPLSVERPAGTGAVSLTLRLDGYLDKPLPMPLSMDTATTEKLQPLPKPSPQGPLAPSVSDGGSSADQGGPAPRPDL